MIFAGILWFFVWGGMFSGIYNIQSPRFLADPLSFIQGARAVLPIFAVYISLLWIFSHRARFPFGKSSLGLFFYYALIGLIFSFLLSPSTIVAVYWGIAYLSPFLVIWITMEHKDYLRFLSKLIYINYVVFIIVTLSVLPEAWKIASGELRFTQFYNLPFHLGQIRSNGVGRFALVVIIVSFVRFISQTSWKRFFWLVLVLPSLFLLAQTQSRTSLLGLAVASLLFVYLKSVDLRFLVVGPVVSYVIWISGIRWRVHGDIKRLLYLTGRENTWEQGLAQMKQTPFVGWGFHGDRLTLPMEHMHNSYLHALIQSGFLGAFFFGGAIISIWYLIFRSGIIRKVRDVKGPDKPLLMESIMILGFLTTRSLFESTGAFYGVDLLLLVPAIAFIYYWVKENQEQENLETGRKHLPFMRHRTQ